MALGCEIESFSFFDKTEGTLKEVMKNLSFWLKDEKEIKLIYGHIGVGKSTLLYILAGLLDNFKGKVYWDDYSFSSLSKKEDKIRYKYLSINFSNFFYLKDMSAEDNIIFPAVFAKKDKNFIRQRIAKLYDGFSGIKLSENEVFNLKDYKNKKIGTLSNGQREIVMLARMLINDSKYLLGDETLRSFNTKVKKQIIKILFKNFNLAQNNSFALITHDDKIIDYMKELAPSNISVKAYEFAHKTLKERV